MGSGQGSEKIYQLIEEFDNGDYGFQLIFENLIKFLPAHTLVEFVDDFKRHYDMNEDEDECYEEPDYHLCMDCQDSYDINRGHVCDVNETQPPSGKSKYFSSLIPEC